MKVKTILTLFGLILLGCGPLPPLGAQTFTVLHGFTNTPDGAYPGDLVLSGGTLLGTTTSGGSSGSGSVFACSTNGAGFAVRHNFTNSPDGAQPNELLLNSNVLFGTTRAGGTNGSGTVFKVGADGTGYTVLHHFANLLDGGGPLAGLVTDGNNLYGTTLLGGSGAGNGTVFRMDTNGGGFTVLHVFTNTPDGANPYASLTLNGTNLYGTTYNGGLYGLGTVFKLSTNGSAFSVIYNFSNAPDASYPYSKLLLVSNVLYGTTSSGGNSGAGGTIFKLATNGTGYAILHSFTGPTIPASNSDGGSPKAGLIFNAGRLYGDTTAGGSGDGGTAFQINLNGTGFAVLKNFTNATDGSIPQASLVVSGGGLFGTAYFGGSGGNGTLFSLLLAPVITAQPQSVTVTNGNPASFTVQATDSSVIHYQWYFNTNTLLAGQTNNALIFTSVANTNAGTYTVVVADNFGAVTSSPAVLTVIAGIAPPSITVPPQSQTITNGLAANFSVTAAGQTPLYYQWYFNTNTGNASLLGNALAGQTNSTLTFISTTNSGGYYSVIITNVAGAVTSSPALLTVITVIIKPSITVPPQSQTITNGFAANFSVTAAGATPLYYQWYFNTNTGNASLLGNALAGQANSTLTFTTTSTSGGYYSVIITNAGGAVTSSPALLTVVAATTAPIITVQPQPLTVISGAAASFSVTVSGRNPLYQWYFNSNLVNSNLLGTALANQTSNTLTFTSAITSGGYYSVVVTNRLGSVTSSPPALLTVITKPLVTLQPQSVTANNGDPVTFTAAAIGAGVLNYQWYFQTNTLVVGATNTTLNFTNAGANLAGVYLMIVSNTYGRATSSLATLTVLTVPTQPKILSFAFNPASGSFSLTLTNTANSVNRLWATTNLTATNFWRTLATNVMPASGLWFFTDTNAAKTNNARFYRFSAP